MVGNNQIVLRLKRLDQCTYAFVQDLIQVEQVVLEPCGVGVSVLDTPGETRVIDECLESRSSPDIVFSFVPMNAMNPRSGPMLLRKVQKTLHTLVHHRRETLEVDTLHLLSLTQ